CGKCVADAGPGLISIASGVAVIDYSLNELAQQRAVERCPTGAIVWLSGAQFVREHAAPGPGRLAPPPRRQLTGSQT
ncbi:MAG TPA: hypothetical protein VHM67_04785, partial [Gemmatimonadaceae bacterium]|nr:hypothetical protein [Gemmatimonadaceae bacterium]